MRKAALAINERGELKRFWKQRRFWQTIKCWDWTKVVLVHIWQTRKQKWFWKTMKTRIKLTTTFLVSIIVFFCVDKLLLFVCLLFWYFSYSLSLCVRCQLSISHLRIVDNLPEKEVVMFLETLYFSVFFLCVHVCVSHTSPRWQLAGKDVGVIIKTKFVNDISCASLHHIIMKLIEASVCLYIHSLVLI